MDTMKTTQLMSDMDHAETNEELQSKGKSNTNYDFSQMDRYSQELIVSRKS